TPLPAPSTSTVSPRSSRPTANRARQAVSPASGNAAASSHENRAGFGKTFSAGTLTSSAYVPPVAPVEARVHDGLLAGVAPHAGAVRAGDHRQRELIRGPRRVADEQVAPVDGRRSQLDHDLARAGHRVRRLLEAKLAARVHADRLHRGRSYGTGALRAGPDERAPRPAARLALGLLRDLGDDRRRDRSGTRERRTQQLSAATPRAPRSRRRRRRSRRP